MAYPEVNLARRIVRKHSFIPPTANLLDLVRIYADVEYTLIPFKVDGMALNLKAVGKRPKILINVMAHERRKKFTLAHELGHVLIPWHTGTIFSQSKEDSSFDWKYREMEAEANRFASELLMPTEWVQNLAAEKNYNIEEIFRHIWDVVGVSPAAASLQLAQCLPPGHIFACVSDNRVLMSAKSDSTMLSTLSAGSDLSDCIFDATADQRCEFNIGPARYIWWYFDPEKATPVTIDRRSWREILDQIVDDLGYDNKQTIKQSINGVISNANSRARRSDNMELLYSTAMQRFSSNEKWLDLITHPDFQSFLIKRVEEFKNKR